MAEDPRDLCTVAEVEAVHRTIGPTEAYRELIQTMITAASVAIMTWSGRQFAPPAEDAEPSTRLYEGRALVGRELPVDDLSAPPSAVEHWRDGEEPGEPLADVVALPRHREAATPVTRLRLPAGVGVGPDDVVAVTGLWGFPQVPPDVRQACIDTADAWLTAAQAGAGPSPEALEAGAVPVAPTQALTRRARALVYPYRRIVLV